MRRLIVSTFASACLLAILPTVASATPLSAVKGTASGTVTAAGGWSFTIQTPGRQTGVVNAMINAANAVTKADFPYVWGGGHAEAGIASVGAKGPGYNGRRRGLDCSGAVAAVLEGGGLWPAGASVPNDAGVISELRQAHLIASGPGRAPVEVTLYDDPGVHIFMNINGRFFGTSDGSGGAGRNGGAGWLNDGAWDAYSKAYRKYHFLRSVLRTRTSQGRQLAFEAPTGAQSAPLLAGDRVKVAYRESAAGVLVATAVSWTGATTTTGTVQVIAGDDSAVTVQTPAGQTLTLSTGSDSALASDLQVGDTVQVTYSRNATYGLVARTVTVTAQAAPPAPPATDPSTPPATDPSTPTVPTDPSGTGYGDPSGAPGPGDWSGGGAGPGGWTARVTKQPAGRLRTAA